MHYLQPEHRVAVEWMARRLMELDGRGVAFVPEWMRPRLNDLTNEQHGLAYWEEDLQNLGAVIAKHTTL